MSKRLICALCLALVACDEAPKVGGRLDAAPTPLDLGAGGQGGGGGAGGAGGDPDVGLVDAAPDSAGSDADVGGADASDAGDGGDPSDAAPVAPLEPGQIAVAANEQRAFVVWAEGLDIKSQALSAEGEDGAPVTRHTRETPATHVAAAVAGGQLWVVFGDEASAHVARADQLDDAPLALSVRPPFRAAPFGEGAQRLIVFGRDEAGALSWQIVTNNEPIEVGPAFTDPRISEVPGSVAPSEVGDVARFGQAGMCQIFDERGEAVASLACLASPGAIVSAGRRPVLTADLTRRNGLRQITVSPVFDFREKLPYAIANALADGPRFAAHGGRYPILGQNNVAGSEEQGRTQLYVVRDAALQQSEETWDRWPYEALAVAVVGSTAWVVDAGPDGRLRFDPVVLTERDFGMGFPLRLAPPDDDCTLGYEVCELPPVCADDPNDVACTADDDCDGVGDNGICCDRFGAEREFIPGPQPMQILASGLYANQLGYRFATRGVEDQWELWYLSFAGDRAPFRVHDCSAAACPNGWSCEPSPWGDRVCTEREGERIYRRALAEGAYEGFGLYALGDYSALIARDSNSAWSIWWYHPSRGLTNPEQSLPKPAPELIGCSEILAADVIEHTADAASMVVVCPDRMVRLYAAEGVEKRDYPLATLDIDPAQWATVTLSTREDPDAVTVLLGTRRGDTRSLKSFIFEVDRPDPRQAALPDALAAASRAGGARLDRPITIHRINPDRPAVALPAGRPPVGNPEILVDGIDGAQWQSVVLAPNPARYAYAKGAMKIVASEESAEATRFWVVDVTADSGVTPWAQRPAFELAGDLDHWTVANTDYSQFLITFRDNDDGTWRVLTRQIGCGRTGLRLQP